MIDGHAKKFHYKDDKLIKACDFDDKGKESNCESHKFDQHGNVIESIMYDEKGIWLDKTTKKYEYYE